MLYKIQNEKSWSKNVKIENNINLDDEFVFQIRTKMLISKQQWDLEEEEVGQFCINYLVITNRKANTSSNWTM